MMYQTSVVCYDMLSVCNVLYVCMYVRTYVRMYIYMYVCIYLPMGKYCMNGMQGYGK